MLAEVQALFAEYKRAPVGNYVVVLDCLSWNDLATVRYGASESLYCRAETMPSVPRGAILRPLPSTGLSAIDARDMHLQG